MGVCIVVLALLLGRPQDTTSQVPSDAAGDRSIVADTLREVRASAHPVILAGDTLFFIFSPLGEFEADERAQQVTGRLRMLSRDSQALDSLRITENDGVSDVLLDTLRVFSVTRHDAAVIGLDRDSAAARYRAVVIAAVQERRSEISIRTLITSNGITILLTALLAGAFWVMRKLFPWLYGKLESWEGKVFPTVRLGSLEIISASSLTAVHLALLKGVRLVLTLVLLYLYLSLVFSLFPETRAWELEPILRGVLLTLLSTVVAGGLWQGGRGLFGVAAEKVDRWRGTTIRGVTIRNLEIFSEERMVALVQTGITGLRYASVLLLAYAYITVVFSLFDFSRTWAGTLLSYVLDPLTDALTSIVSYIPDLFFIVVTIFITRFVLKIIRSLFEQVARGKVTFAGFHHDWAMPTYQIVRFLVIAFAVIVIFPHLPGSGSPAFQGVSVFLGVLFSLGSTSAIANIVAGVVLTYMRPFRIGDRVRIADTMGDVVERNLLVTRVRTVKNVDITVPNAMVLGSHIVNYSSSAKEKGLILHTKVTIGYDVSWRKVHELLIAAANDTTDVSKDPTPFVLQTSLDDHSVAYELNAFTDEPTRMAAIYSELHQHVQDRFNEAGVEIMSPQYTAVRDGNQVAIPEDYLPESYAPPSFRFLPCGNPSGRS